jgi:hypothetical protein
MMEERELRELVREAMARRAPGEPLADVGSRAAGAFDRSHPSHLVLPVAPGSEGDGACLIEPGVRCNHCGFCMSYGH